MSKKQNTKVSKETRDRPKASGSSSKQQPRELSDAELEVTAGGAGGRVIDCEGYAAVTENINTVNKVDGFAVKQKI